ncbi:nucleoside hydrolase [Corynebacterium sp. LK2510]|uniref:nucleoside hydrolase n=1 Tax=Corynebacterium sp. LK2510 TaxID=3110472 RepID=UPI0034CFE8F6
MARKLILDLDTGIDDALALAFALGSPDAELIGVTATYGNVDVATSAHNTLALLELFGRTDVPVYCGPGHARAADRFAVSEVSALIHGRNGLGEVTLLEARRGTEPLGAVEFLLDSHARYGAELVIVPTGPLTTIAAAVEASADFAANAQIVFMGGALTVPGNVTPWSEANIHQDPEAANLVLRRAANVTMVGLDVTLRTLLTRAETAQWQRLGTRGGDALSAATNHYIDAYAQLSPHLGGCGLHDPLAVAVALDPGLCTFLDVALKVDLDEPTRGRTIGDETRLNDDSRTTRAAVAVDATHFHSVFMRRVTAVAARDTQR